VVRRHGHDDRDDSPEHSPFWCLRLVLTTLVFTTVLIAAGHSAACLCFVHEGTVHHL